MNIIIGIYKVTNPKGAVYIGESKDIERRWNNEYTKLKCKKQRKLYNSFVCYGVENHIFEIVKECTIEEIPYYERHYQEYYNVLDKDYGLNLKYTKVGEKKGVHSDETRKKMSESAKGKIISNEQREKLRIANIGKKHTEETKKKISKISKGRKHTEESKKKMSESKKGQNHSDETKRLISEKNKGRIISEQTRSKKSNSMKGKNIKKIINIETKEVYNSLKEMCKILNLSYCTTSMKLNGKRKNNTPFRYLNN
jgi:group I intron endonuclease